MIRRRKYLLPIVAVLVFALVPSASAQDSNDASSPTSIVDGHEACCCVSGCSGGFWTRDKLLGDWLGARSCLSNHGIIADLQLTQFYQGGVSGGAEQKSKYGGKLDYFFIFQGERLGLWRGLTAVMHAETRFGEDVLDVVGLAPVNVNMLYPSFNNETAITGLQIEQALHDGWSLSAGKINSLDFFYAIYPQTGRGVDGFMNTSMIMPLAMGRTLPPAIIGAGVLKRQDSQIQGGLFVYDSKDVSTTSGLDNLFDNGANIVGLWRFFTNVGCKPGSHLLGGTWASGNFTSLDPLDWVILPGPGLVSPAQTGSWGLLYVFDQQLWVDPSNASRSVGLLSAWSLADKKTSPFHWTCNVGSQGQGLVGRREDDTMGVGYFYSGLSSDFESLLAAAALDVSDLQGVEVYYNFEVTPWFHVTADLQVIEPAHRAHDTALALGVRAKMDL
jgi:porin